MRIYRSRTWSDFGQWVSLKSKPIGPVSLLWLTGSMTIQRAIITAGAIIAGGLQFNAGGNRHCKLLGGDYRQWATVALGLLPDRWTGTVALCAPSSDKFPTYPKFGVGLEYRCSEIAQGELDANKVDPSRR